MTENFYLRKYGFRVPQISLKPDLQTELIVVVPCYNEPDIVSSLASLANCEFKGFSVEVITVLNAPDNCAESILNQNKRSLKEGEDWAKENSTEQITFHFIEANDLPKKHAGVGLARKIGMDEAVARFHTLDKDGVIVMYDADSKCDSNYLQAIYDHFLTHSNTPGCSIRFEHPLSGNEFEQEIYEGITKYELFLRYYYEGLKVAGVPYAFYTVGSSMAVRSSAYQKQGGMNKRKAGEDFYFAQKIIELGGYTELNSTRVIPSPRTSDRVPFGTGKAINDWMCNDGDEYFTYDPKSFFDLLNFFSQLRKIYEGKNWRAFASKALITFLEENSFDKGLVNVRSNSTNYESFSKRFFVWFNAFRLLKFVHYARDNFHEQVKIEEAAKRLLETEMNEADELLTLYRTRHSVT